MFISFHRIARVLALVFLLGGLSGTTQAAPTASAVSPPTVLIFGDSLSAGYGIAIEQSWPSLLDKRLDRASKPWHAANASISGETTAGGRARLAAALDQFKPAVLVLALGANDGLRGLPVTQLRDNLDAMLTLAKQRKVRVLLVGMRLPPNYGPAYNTAFETAYTDLAKQHKTALLPFLLAPIAGDANAFQTDRLHPIAAVQGQLLEHVWPALKPLLK
jgi:acyl-CoA thioesterase I